MTVARTLRLAIVVQAVETQRLLSQRLLGHVIGTPGGCWQVRNRAGEVTQASVARKDLEALRERLDVVAEEKVVCKHTADLGNEFSLAIGVDEMQRRRPMCCQY